MTALQAETRRIARGLERRAAERLDADEREGVAPAASAGVDMGE